MKIVKPSWVNYKGEPIISIHFHPNGKSFATGGVFNDSGQVSVWSTESVYSEPGFHGNVLNNPRLLSQMSNHHGCVNCVRWNYAGNWLASAGVDKSVIIWQKRKSSNQNISSTKFSSEDKFLESWSSVFILRGHSGEILDLGWSLSDNLLASCSVDNSIIVWNGLHLPSKLHIIKQHSGMVKGLSWDPIGKYLASQSDDRTLRIWRTEDWVMETQISKPFIHCSGTTHLLRLSWSPDGRNIVTAHALNNAFPVSHVIDRNNWNADKSLVGHQKAIEVAAFNPNIFSYDPAPSTNHTIVALGSKDGSISIWSTAKTKPVLVFEEVFSSSILDLSWASNGFQLLACSWDSSIALLTFSQLELGCILESSVLLKLHLDVYGCTSLPSTLDCCSSSVLIESPNILAIQLPNQTFELPNSSSISKELLLPPENSISEQFEVLTKEGKRRITPSFISPPAQSDYAPVRRISPITSTDPESLITCNQNGVPPDVQTNIDTSSENYACNESKSSLRVTSHSVSLSVPSGIVLSDDKAATLDIESNSIPTSFVHESKYYKLHIDNMRSYGALLKVTLPQSSASSCKYWETILVNKVVLFCCTDCFIVTSCTDFSLHIFTISGRKVIAPLFLPTQAFNIRLDDKYLIYISTHFYMYMWELRGFKCLISQQPISPLHNNKKLKIVNLTVRDSDPILTLSDDNSFVFSTTLHCWQLIQINFSYIPRENVLTHPFSSLHLSGSNAFVRNQYFLESQVNSSLATKSVVDLQYWLYIYVEFLSEHNLECQLKELFVELFEPTFNSSEISLLSPIQVLISKDYFFLSRILEIVAKNMHLQRIYSEFSDCFQKLAHSTN